MPIMHCERVLSLRQGGISHLNVVAFAPQAQKQQPTIDKTMLPQAINHM
jgi:hypothetical protein